MRNYPYLWTGGTVGMTLRVPDRWRKPVLGAAGYAIQQFQYAEQERQRATQAEQREEKERQRATQAEQREEKERQRANRLAERLRALGIDPENL